MLTTSGLSILLHGVILLPDMTSYDKTMIITQQYIKAFTLKLHSITVI